MGRFCLYPSLPNPPPPDRNGSLTKKTPPHVTRLLGVLSHSWSDPVSTKHPRPQRSLTNDLVVVRSGQLVVLRPNTRLGPRENPLLLRPREHWPPERRGGVDGSPLVVRDLSPLDHGVLRESTPTRGRPSRHEWVRVCTCACIYVCVYVCEILYKIEVHKSNEYLLFELIILSKTSTFGVVKDEH